MPDRAINLTDANQIAATLEALDGERRRLLDELRTILPDAERRRLLDELAALEAEIVRNDARLREYDADEPEQDDGLPPDVTRH